MKRLLNKILAGALSVCMLGCVSAFAADAPGTGRITFQGYDSKTYTKSLDGREYDYYTTLYYSGTTYKTGVWMIADGNVPAGALYLEAYLCDENGDVRFSRADKNSVSTHFLFVETKTWSTSKPLLYAAGYYQITGTDGAVTSRAMPIVQYDNGSIREVTSMGRASREQPPMTSQGLTYGSVLWDSVEDLDLIAAVGTDGVRGYVLRGDFSPAFGAAWTADDGDRLIPLYDLDGRQIGQFDLGAPSEEEYDSLTAAKIQRLMDSAPASDGPDLPPVSRDSGLDASLTAQLEQGLENGAYPRNSQGLTYGSLLARYLLGYAPNLAAVVGDEGQRGYVPVRELERAADGTVLAVYDLFGRVIDRLSCSAE